jgi:hypothetical protein
MTLIRFKDLAVGETFSFVPMNPPFTAFNVYGEGCMKKSARKYSRLGWEYTMDSVNREVVKQ